MELFHNLHVEQSGDELSSKDLRVPFVLMERLLEEGPHGSMVADNRLILLLHSEVKSTSGLLHESWTDEDLPEPI